MTDREKLVELLDLKVYDDWYCNEDIADFLIANGVTFATDTDDADKWISTVEHLPKSNVPVVVVREDTKGKRYFSVEVFGTNDGEHWFWSKDDVSWKLIVTHWMPLPEVPKEG